MTRWLPWSLARIVLPAALVVAGWATFHRFMAANILLHEPAEEEVLLAAAGWDPRNPEARFLLGVYYRDRLASHQLGRALRHLEEAVALNPARWRYRWELGRTYELAGRLAEAEEAYQAAIERNPGSADHRWRLANFHLRTGNREAAQTHFGAAVELQPSLGRQALVLLAQSGASAEEVAAHWPADPEARAALLSGAMALMGEGDWPADPGFLRRQWEGLLAAPEPPGQRLGAAYVDRMLQLGATEEARQGWIELAERLGHRDLDFRERRNLVWSGSFAAPVAAASRLDWRLGRNPGLTSRVVADGSWGNVLELSLAPGARPPAAALEQEVVVEPATAYRASFRARSDGSRSDHALLLEIRDSRTGSVIARSRELPPAADWQQAAVSFRSPEDCRVIQLRVRSAPREGRADGELSWWLGGLRLEIAEAP